MRKCLECDGKVVGAPQKRYCSLKCRRMASRRRNFKNNRKCHRSWRELHGRKKELDQARDSGYTAYRNIIDRCTNPNSRSYQRYGGRGIELRINLEEFRSVYFSINKCSTCSCLLNDSDRRRSKHGRTIDRIDVDGHYQTENLRVVCRSCNSSLRKKV